MVLGHFIAIFLGIIFFGFLGYLWYQFITGGKMPERDQDKKQVWLMFFGGIFIFLVISLFFMPD